MSLGENVKRIRRERGLSQSQLAERADVSKSMISSIERGTRKTSYDSLVQLTHALNCKLSDLTGNDYINKEKIDEESWLLFADRMQREGYSLDDIERWVEFAKQFVEKDIKKD